MKREIGFRFASESAGYASFRLPAFSRSIFTDLIIGALALLDHINDRIAPPSISPHSARSSALPSQFYGTRCIHYERLPIRPLPYHRTASATLLHNSAGQRKGRRSGCRR